MKRTISQTPAPMKDSVYGSKKNRKGSSKDLESAKSIVFDEKTLNAVESKVKSHNAKYPQKKITLSSAKAVVRRGMGAYSGSHRPTISGGKPNSRNAWGLARLNAFLYKIINGESKSGKYSQDNDLINELGYKVAKYNEGGNVEDLISKGIVELKMFDTKPEHAKEYGFDVKKPLYVQSICISENERLKGIGKKVLDYIDEYAVKKGHDLIFGHISYSCDIYLIKEFLRGGGYSTIKGNNDFYKVIKTNSDIRFDGGGLIAPNGQVSNLTPVQYELVRTNEFKSWFGDWENDPENASKVLDENGEPLVMYSGSPRQFTIFESDEILVDKDDKEFKPRFWFTIDKEYADSLASKTFGTPTIYICFLNIRNPKYDNFNLYVDEFYDGSIQYNRKNINVVTAINSNQIKLADGTNTTFDSNNSDIRFDGGGNVEDFETETRNLIAVLKKAVLLETGEEKEETERLIKELESELPTPTKEELKYTYLMTLDEYLNSGIPQLISEYEKFIRKNEEYLAKYGWGKSINRYTLPEALEMGKSSPFYSEKDVMGRPNTNVEKKIREDFGYSITREFDDEFDIDTPEDVVNKNREYRARLLQHFTEKELTNFESDYKKTNKRVIKNSMDNKTYFKLIKEGKLDISRLEDITQSVGVRITKETYSADKGAELKEFLKSIKVPQQNYGSLLEFGKKIKIDLEPIRQTAYDREYARYKTNILESVGKTLRDDRLKLLIPFWYVVVDVEKNVIRTSRMYSGREYYEEKYEYTIKSLKNDWEEQLSKEVNEFVEVLMFKIVTTIIKTITFVKIPFASVKTKAVKIGVKGFEGIYEINFTDGSKFDLVTEGIEAGGYNIQAFHYRYISKIENMILPNGQATKSDSHFREYKEVRKFDGGGLTEKPDTKRNLSKYELEAIKRSIEDPLLSPRLKESFQKLLNSRKIDDNVDFSRFPEGKYIDPYDFSGYDYMRNQNEENGVSFLLTGEYKLVSKAIYERDYSMWLFYNYTARINISLENARRWVKQAQDYFINTMPIPVNIRHDPKAKDGRSYARWMKGARRSLEQYGIDPSFSYDGNYYGNLIGMVANGDNKNWEGWGAMYPEKKTGLYVPEFTETSFHFNTIMHEFAHCLDFQTQLVNNIKKYEGKKSSSGDVKLSTKEMSQLEKELYGEIIRDEESVTAPITNHFDYFIDSLIKILRASSSGEIPLTQKFEQQALDVQIALSGLYGDILLEQRERKKQQSQEIAVLDEARENKRFTWQSKRIPEFIKYVQAKAIQKDMANELSKTSSGRKISLSEILELDSLINQFADEYLNIYAVKYPSKMDTFYSNLKEIKNEANRIIANHYDNIKRDYQFGFYPVTELDIYLSENCRLRDFRDYKSWKECSEGIIREKLK